MDKDYHHICFLFEYQASFYDIRIADTPTQLRKTFTNCTDAMPLITTKKTILPNSAGGDENVCITMPRSTRRSVTYLIALKVLDERNNTSPLSNIVVVTFDSKYLTSSTQTTQTGDITHVNASTIPQATTPTPQKDQDRRMENDAVSDIAIGVVSGVFALIVLVIVIKLFFSAKKKKKSYNTQKAKFPDMEFTHL